MTPRDAGSFGHGTYVLGMVTSIHADRSARDRSSRMLASERRIRWLAHVLDDLIPVPGTGRRIGLKPLVGLVPWVGDVIGAAPGAWLIVEAARFRLPGSVLARMVLNLIVDFVVGLIPIVGDLFDFGF